MAKVYRNPTVQWYKDQIGYSSGSSKSSKYSKTLDSVSWYNYRKNGYANWCGIYYDAGIYENASDYDDIDEVRALVFEPNSDNCGAGCAQKISYYQSAGRFFTDPQDAQCGDEIFFGSSDYVSDSNPYGAYHTGAIIDWGEFDELVSDSNPNGEGFKTSEGNTNGTGDVSERFYSYGDSRIIGFGRPDWTADDPEETEKPSEPEPTEPDPTPEPTPEPAEPSKSVDELAHEVIEGKWGNGKDRAERLTEAGYDYQAVQDRVNEILGVGSKPSSSGRTYTVNVNTRLNVRYGPGTDNPIKYQLKNGDKVTVYEKDGDWGRIGDDEWVCMDYLV